jgi:hypothetical protein
MWKKIVVSAVCASLGDRRLVFSIRALYGVDNPTSHEEAPTMTRTVSSRPTFLADLPGI